MNWKSYVEKQNEKNFILPPGWTPREEVAEQLGCSTERVDEQLRPGLKSGEIEKQQFRVWDKRLKKIVLQIAYRSGGEGQPSGAASREWTKQQREEAEAMKRKGASFAEIGRKLGCSPSAARHRMKG